MENGKGCLNSMAVDILIAIKNILDECQSKGLTSLQIASRIKKEVIDTEITDKILDLIREYERKLNGKER